MKDYIVILYTTKYRKGGAKFMRVAKTMAQEFHNTDAEVLCIAVESKRKIVQVFEKIDQENRKIKELHFVGHAGMYGPMYRTVEYPEQFSPYEIEHLNIPFAENAKAFFHCCRSARWFAPYFARKQGVPTYGYYWYTAFSRHKNYFRVDLSNNPDKKLYCFGCEGKKSHGYLASLKKYFGKQYAEEMKCFEPQQATIGDSYEDIANEYQTVFSDIKVRKDEYKWIEKHLPQNNKIKVLDIGCGNGALLKEISNKIGKGVGLDVSENQVNFAKKSNESNENLSFGVVTSPEIPFGENQFDVVISLMSFRYLDWDPIMHEIQRVLKAEGKLLIVDMVSAPVKWREMPFFFICKLKNYWQRYQNPEFYKKLTKMVTNPAWREMLKYNPIRSQHEMKWFLESRFPDRKVEVINIGYHSRIIAFDSENMKNIKNLKLTYP